MIDNRLPDGIFDRHKATNEMNACLEYSLMGYLDAMIDVSDIWDSALMETIDAGQLTPNETAEIYRDHALLMQSAQAALLQIEPPTCLSSISDKYLNDQGFETITNSDFVVLQEDLRRWHEAAQEMTDAGYECIAGMERFWSDLESYAGEDPAAAILTLCNPVLSAAQVYDAYETEILAFLVRVTDAYDQE